MSPNGSGVKRLTSNGRDSYPVCSPDGTRIAFIRIVGAQWRLFVMSADGKHQRRLGLAPPAGRPNWTLDGKAILIPAGADLVKVDAVTGRPLTYYGIALDVQTGQTATVSPDGRQLAFVGPRVSTGPPDCGEGRCPQFGLYLASVRAPHRVHRVVNDTGAAGWSPDGKTLAYVSKGTLTLRVLASGVETKLPTDAHQADGDAPPAWSPR
jgi:Tol biopolymer transport system component